MAVFISVTTNAFEEVFQDAQVRPSPRNLNIRRPLRGIEVKDDTYALIKVIDLLGNELPLLDSSSPVQDGGIGKSTAYSNFILTQVQEARTEKQQIVETFGEDFIFFFGERPRTLNIQGVLINTNDFNWKSEFWENWEKHMRGTRLLENNARMYLYFDDVVVEGYPLNAQTVHTADLPYQLPLQMQFFVTNYAILSSVGSVFIPKHRSEMLAESSSDTLVDGGLGPVGSDAITAGEIPGGVPTGGGLNAFLSASASFSVSATFSIQSTLENIKNTLFGRRLVSPSLGAQVLAPPLVENQGKFGPGERGLPIHNNRDEYIESEGLKPTFDEAELARVQGVLSLSDPKALEIEARAQLLAWGIDPTPPNANYLLLGRAAFAGLQLAGSFGIRQVDGLLNVGSQLP